MAAANGKGTVATTVEHAIAQIAAVLTWFTTGKGVSPYLSVSQKAEHRTPYLASLILAVRSAYGLSQTELGDNRRRNGEPAFANVNGSGWFSVVANVEQGGRRTPIPAGFLDYISTVANVDRKTVEAMATADSAIMAGFGKVNRQANRTHNALTVCDRCGATVTDATTVEPIATEKGIRLVHKGKCPSA
jgi:hypothetical protein